MKLRSKLILGCTGTILFFIVAFVIFGLVFYFNSENWIAKSPKRICKEAGFKLPSYIILEEEDNMERGSSSWSWYYWRIKLKKPLSEKDIQKLENLVEKDPNWKGSPHDIFEYKNYKDYWEPGYNSEIDTFISPQIHIVIYSTDEISIKYYWNDFFA